jgi:hypothetical protein
MTQVVALLRAQGGEKGLESAEDGRARRKPTRWTLFGVD